MAAWFPQLVAAISNATTQQKSQLFTEESYKQVLHHIPDTFSLPELLVGATEAISSSKVHVIQYHAVVLGILASLRSADGRITQSDDDSAAVGDLALLVARAFSPVDDETQEGAEDEDTDMLLEEEEDTNQKKYRQLSQRSRTIAPVGIEALQLLANYRSLAKVAGIDDVFLTLIASTSPEAEDAWITPETAQQATALLGEQLPAGNPRAQFIVDGILQGYLRPLFSKSKPPSITASGRKAAYTEENATRGQGIPDDSRLTKPWKFTDYRAIPIIAWAVHEADERLISKHWPLFIPVLLTLVDDNATGVRARGLVILTNFLAKFPDKTLHDTGLGQVFEEAVSPTLSYLPSLTPEDDSVRLLVPAFQALRCLAGKQSAPISSSTQKPPQNWDLINPAKEKEYKMLDRLLRHGLFPAYFHAKDHIRIVEVLCQQMALILCQMGVHSVKHLKDIIPMLSTIMTDPFAPLSPPTLLAAINALQATLTTCRPRILPSSTSPWQDEIIKSLVLCWLIVHDHEQDQTQQNLTTASQQPPDVTTAKIKHELIISASALGAVLKTRTEAEGQAAPTDDPLGELVAPLVSKEPILAGLFSPWPTPQPQPTAPSPPDLSPSGPSHR